MVFVGVYEKRLEILGLNVKDGERKSLFFESIKR
jgi:hypothetical protein